MTASFVVPGPLPGLNEIIEAAKGAGGSGTRYAKLKEEWTLAVWAHAKKARLPKFTAPVFICFHWDELDRRRDPDNVAAGRKFVLDGLVQAGVLAGDGWKHVAGWVDHFAVVDAKAAGVRVMLTDVPRAD